MAAMEEEAAENILSLTPALSEEEASISSAEEPKKKPRRKLVIDWECVNADCNTTGRVNRSLVETASSFVVAFYGGEKDQKKKRKICGPCHSRAMKAQSNMLDNLFNEDLLFKGQTFPQPKDMVWLEDSEEEPQTDTSDESEFGISEEEGKLNLEELVESSLKKFNIQHQTTECLNSLSQRLEVVENDYKEHEAEFKEMEKQLDAMRMDLYQPFRPKLISLEPVDLDSFDEKEERKTARQPDPSVTPEIVKSSTSDVTALPPPNLPPIGKLSRLPLNKGQLAYTVRGDILNVWKKGTVVENPSPSCYKVRVPIFREGVCLTAHVRTCYAKMLAYAEPATVRLQVGTRIIGVYNEEFDPALSGEFYSGIVAEPPKAMNKHRYLVFFDDGYASYIRHEDIRVVCEQTENHVWDDIHPNSREFIKKYLMQYPERPMVRLVKGQVVRTEWEGSWWYTRVEDVDASLVRLVFHVNERKESIYRGSTRLEPLYIEMQQQKKRSEGQTGFSRHNRGPGGNKPYVEYTRQTDGNEQQVRRAVARKSTGGSSLKRNEDAVQVPRAIDWSMKGSVKDVKVDCAAGVPFIKHQCGASCMMDPRCQYDAEKVKNVSPLLIPMKLGWKRQFTMYRSNGRRQIYYAAPCGRRMRNLEEVHRYLRVTNSRLEIDFFNFEWYVHAFREFAAERNYLQLEDISYGHENISVSCVNSLDKTYPDYIEYSTKRLPQSNVNVNLDDGFLSCCDCVDDCQDKDKCACWQLTISHTNATSANVIDSSVGYVYRRLHQSVSTGIFECNHKCKCRSTCVNRVAQKPLRQKLQVFKTQKRGWGIRALNDIPKGAFICVYVGNLYTNVEANWQGQTAGDEYFAELDLIETLERQKEGYESDVEEDEAQEKGEVEILDVAEKGGKDDDDYVAEESELEVGDPEFVTAKKPSIIRDKLQQKNDRTTRSRNKISDEAASKEGSRMVRAFTASFDAPPAPKVQPAAVKPKHTSTRKFFGKDEDVYIMDAKSIGNIGRYLNHSCNPNVFVQNCFVDTHDIRFPWVAFFTLGKVSAGEELCWDYCYIVDQVKGKEIYCQCGATNCRGRLL